MRLANIFPLLLALDVKEWTKFLPKILYGEFVKNIRKTNLSNWKLNVVGAIGLSRERSKRCCENPSREVLEIIQVLPIVRAFPGEIPAKRVAREEKKKKKKGKRVLGRETAISLAFFYLHEAKHK